MIWFLAFLACNKGNNSEIPEGFPAEFYGTDHQITTYIVEDACFDGAMNALFMPQGNDSPQEFEYPVYIPSLDELPLTYEISLREPFVGMEMTASAGSDGIIEIGDAQMEEVALGGTFGDCVATMDVTATITPSVDHFEFDTTIAISNLRGDEVGCPVPQAEPCTVKLFMRSVPSE